LVRVVANSGLSSRSDLAHASGYQSTVQFVAQTFDAIAFVPVLFHELKSAAPICDLVCWAVEEHVKNDQRAFFCADASVDVYTRIVEYFLERTVGFFFGKLVSSVKPESSLQVCVAILENLNDVFEMPQSLLLLIRKLEGGQVGSLFGLLFGSVLGGALVRQAQASEDPLKQLYLGAKVFFTFFCFLLL
jgi:hypothetical protein